MTALLKPFCAELTTFTRGGTTDLKSQAKPQPAIQVRWVRVGLRLLSKGWGPRGEYSSGPVPFCKFRPEKAAAVAAEEDDSTQDVSLLRFGQPIDETKKKGTLRRVVCAVRMPGTSREGASIQGPVDLF